MAAIMEPKQEEALSPQLLSLGNNGTNGNTVETTLQEKISPLIEEVKRVKTEGVEIWTPERSKLSFYYISK